ncbi:penicillin-binding protein 2 [Alphaproteobacteria bacterium]|nr:penicillin-binding protein 2 [Alphaproteobacteria bacterium]
MYNEKKIKNKIIRRVIIIGSFKLLIFSIILGRLYKLQVVDRQKYKTLANKNRINLVFHAPVRGKVLDSIGNIIADNRKIFLLTLNPSHINNMDLTINSLKNLINISDEESNIFYTKLKESEQKHITITLKKYLSWEQLSIISVNKPKLPGVNIEFSSIREYKRGSYFAHILGYTSNDKDKNNKDNITGNFPYGLTGIEKVYDSYLRGVPGVEQVEVNAQGSYVRRLNMEKSKQGYNVQLTINSQLQDYTHKIIGSNVGAALIIDANNGNILSSASSPSYDPNIFSRTLSDASWQKIISSENAPLINRPIKGLYPPGSTFKPVVALAALKYGIIKKTDKVFCNGSYTLGNRDFHCWNRVGHGHVNLTDAISQSCDVYFYEIALKLGIEKIAESAKLLGFGSYYDEYFGISKGIVPNKKWKIDNYNESWQKGETLNVGIGQGFLLSTPLELAIMTGNLINGGKVIRPNIIKSLPGDFKAVESIVKHNNFKIEHLNIIKKAMFNVVNTRKGTAWKSRTTDKDFSISGKTGTSQVRIISAEERASGIIKNKDLPLNKRDHALFIGFAPFNKPKYITSVVLEHAGGGSASAAPIGRDLLIASRKIIEGIDTEIIVS